MIYYMEAHISKRVIDRDYNASLNLLSLIIKKQIGADYPESMPEDLTALLSRFA